MEAAKTFKLRKDKIDTPGVYLRGTLVKNSLNGNEIWNMSNADYVKTMIQNLKVRLYERRNEVTRTSRKAYVIGLQ